MFRNPFDRQPASVLRWGDYGPLREALIAVPITGSTAVACRVVVPTGDGSEDWPDRACIAAIVTVAAVRARLQQSA